MLFLFQLILKCPVKYLKWLPNKKKEPFFSICSHCSAPNNQNCFSIVDNNVNK